MAFFKRKSRFRWPVLILAIIFLGTALAGSGYGENLRFVFMADSRGNSLGKLINTEVLQEINGKILALSPRPAFILFGGDLALVGVNADGSNNFRAFKEVMQPLTEAGIKLYVALGNHELYKEGTKVSSFHPDNQRQYQQAFADLPANGPPGYEHLVYSFLSPGGDAFFAVLDPYYLAPGTEQPLSKKSGAIDQAQLSWLGRQMAETKASHKFICMHVPVHQVTNSTAPDAHLELWSLLDKALVEIFFCGHIHLFSRKAIDHTVDPRWRNKVVQLICGTCGAPPVPAEKVVRDFNDWHIHVGSHNYSVVDLDGPKVTVNSYGGKNDNYKVIDSFIIPETR